MREQSQELKKLRLGNGKTYDKVNENDVIQYIEPILKELLNVQECLNDNEEVRYVAITCLNITQYLSSIFALGDYLESTNDEVIKASKKQEFLQTIKEINKTSDYFYKAVFQETVYSAILRADELEMALRHLIVLCQ